MYLYLNYIDIFDFVTYNISYFVKVFDFVMMLQPDCLIKICTSLLHLVNFITFH